MLNKELTNKDYCDAAKDLRCEVAALMAVAEVESSGGGYDENGRIKVRFEGHKFREYTSRRFDITHPHLSYPYKVQQSKPHGYSAFNEAFALDEESALKASSFGKFQPLAVNYREAEFKNVRAFVDFLRVSERNQLLVFCAMVKFRDIDDELRRKDWADFARNYNGSAYRDNDYDGKMRRAYERYKKLRINCNEFADLTDDEINLDIPEDYSASGNLSRSDAISAQMSDLDGADELKGGSASDSNAAAQQVAENITNVSTGDKNVPDNFVAEDKTVDAPAPSGMMNKAKLWFSALGIGIPTGAGVIEAIKNSWADGAVNIREVFAVVAQVAQFVLPYAAYIAIAFIIFWAIKELLKQLSLMLSVYVTAKANMHNVQIAPVAKTTGAGFFKGKENEKFSSRAAKPLGIN